MSMSLPKVALVTGASRGIGHAIAIRLAEMGFQVIGTSTSSPGVEKIESALNAFPYKGQGWILDLASPASRASFKKSLEGIRSLSVLVNNAGIAKDNLLLRMKEEEWKAVIDVNLNALYYVTRACIKPMVKARSGRIVNISSVVASTGNAGQTNYVASKAGIEGFTRALAQEVAPWNITVNAVAPGMIETDMIHPLPTEYRDAFIKQRIPLKRLGKPRDIAHMVGFLCLPDSGYITGQTFHVNGGLYMG
ncbi:MAG: 3-oxoacyl-ACP reductase FabG [Gammaproteobacteria bacterium]|nr:3-oxoacyl-ACP reductase FabG [Gammaproteobacteria bacterium]